MSKLFCRLSLLIVTTKIVVLHIRIVQFSFSFGMVEYASRVEVAYFFYEKVR